MESTLFSYGIALIPITYVVIFVGMAIEGESFLILTAMLARDHIINFVPGIIFAYFGIIIGDYAWYFIGTKIKDNTTGFFGKRIKKFSNRFDYFLKNHTVKAISTLKFAYGIHHIMLLRAGNLRISVKKIFITDALISIPWMFMIGAIGYFSSGFLLHTVKFIEIAIVIIIVAFIVFDSFISKLIRLFVHFEILKEEKKKKSL